VAVASVLVSIAGNEKHSAIEGKIGDVAVLVEENSAAVQPTELNTT
jgi:hypothetical protein